MKIQSSFSFLKRAVIPYDYNTGLQIRDFWRDFHKKSLERGDFEEAKTDMKQMSCYQKDLTSNPLSKYYVFPRFIILKCLVLTKLDKTFR